MKGKESAAKRWANYVSDDSQVGNQWRYLLLSEDDVDRARGPGRH